MKTTKFLLTILSIIFFHNFLHADVDPADDSKSNKGIIAGRIIDEQNLPLPGATVLIKSLNEATVSDVNGYYRLVKIEPGHYELTVTYIGFKAQSQQVRVAAGETTIADFRMEAGIELNEVVVTGGLQGQSKALNQQKNTVNITNIISSDQVGRFPDANIGDALKRIPGINVQYDQGEARFGHIRGTSPEYNSVTIDGDRIPSAEAEIRAVQLDLVPADMIQSMEVNKVVTADMDADAIGGSVNLVTRSNPYRQRLSGTVGTTYNLLSEKPTENISLLYADRFLNNKLGMTLAGSYQNHQLGSDNIEAEWDEADNGMIMKEFQVRTYHVQRLRQSYSAAFDYAFNPSHKIDAKVMYNHRNDWENRYRVVYADLDEPGESTIERQLKAGKDKDARLEDQRTFHVSLKGEHQLGMLGIKWKGAYAKASEERPNERYLQYVYEDVTINQDLSDTEKPHLIVTEPDAVDFNGNWELDELTEQYQYTEDIDKVVGVDFKLPLSPQGANSILRVGAKYKSKSKNRENDFYEYSPEDETAFNSDAFSQTKVQTKDNFLAGDYVAGTFVKKEFLGNLDLENVANFEKEQDPEELAGNFDAKEDVLAGYIRFDQKIGKLDVLAGLRIEDTKLEYSGYEIVLDEDGDFESLNKTQTQESGYTNVLPSLLLKYALSNNTQLKAGWTNTIARPRYYDLVPHVETNREDNELTIGNPGLEPTTSMNFDLMLEHYFKSVGLISGGVFYKDINDFIVEEVKDDYSFMNNTWDEFSQPINAGNATLYGFEVAFQRQLDFLPGFLRQFGIYANYTYTKSEVSDFKIEDRENEELSLPGTPENNFNASLYYEGKKLSARLSFNYASDFIDEVGGEAFEDRYYDKVTYMDFNTSYAFSNKLRVFAEVNNLLNTPLRYYQGESKYTMQAEYYNAKINFGLKFDL
ncbi:TonB-dependent receptor [Gaoshiqia sediminis]|uniref:TonB-dependent receptor n=1 Tax=Gaoshiqia sediminis TaxID=2986998 RepID=A0AA41Y9V7_9BACT|nr:TonB-dependent receptor [Gaoshiqia sediminis]MCW0483952.1 TonB-dependent receptor [Gaoshiqia sediminis]